MKENRILSQMIRFQTDRNLHKQNFDIKVASMNILEELMEAHGVEDDCKKSKRERKELAYRALNKLVNEVKMYQPEKFKEPTDNSIIDAFMDIAEFSIGEPLKLGYDPIICLNEMQREINSREGSIIDGKFEKYIDEESISNWYKANYSNAKIRTDYVESDIDNFEIAKAY